MPEVWKGKVAEVSDKTTVADALFEAETALRVHEESVSERLLSAGWDFYEFWTDWYDGSIEIHVAGMARPTAECLRALWNLGFARAWFHYDAGDEREMYACAPHTEVTVTPRNESRRGAGLPDRSARAVWAASRRAALVEAATVCKNFECWAAMWHIEGMLPALSEEDES